MRDVIVIGAGGGGPVVAKELAARGLDVLLIEAGPRNLNPQRDWSGLENDAHNPVTGYLRNGPADRGRPGWLRELPQNSFLFQVSGVGGTTQHYFANTPRAMPGVFRGYRGRDRDAYDRAHEFPFSYRTLLPYYEWVEHTLPVQTAPMATKDQVFLRGAGRLGLPVQKSKDITRAARRPQENAILQPHGTAGRTSDSARLRYPQARGCTACGGCVEGCHQPIGAPRNLAAKRSTDNSYVPMALTADAWHRGGRAATLITDASVTRILTTRTGSSVRATGVKWRDNASGETNEERAHVVVLAAGAIETPRLWLNSRLPNPNGWVGRGLTDHHLDFVTGAMPFDYGATRGAVSGARCDFPGRGSFQTAGLLPALQAAGANASDSGMAGLYDNGAPVGSAGADRVGRLVGNDLREFLSHGIDRLATILVLTDDDVQPENGVSLSALPLPDEQGSIPRVEMNHRQRTARTRGNREFLVQRAVKLLRKAGATRVYRWNLAPILLHVHSTMRMGTDAGTSVLKASGEARAVNGLFVADNSALANSIGGPNPTLTTQALATRTAENIFKTHFGGDRWVRREAPVVSTDPRVTRAVVRRHL